MSNTRPDDDPPAHGVLAGALSGLQSALSDWYEELRPTTVPVQAEPLQEPLREAGSSDDIRDGDGDGDGDGDQLGQLKSEESHPILMTELRSQAYDEVEHRCNRLDLESTRSMQMPRRSSLADSFLPVFSWKGSSRWICEDGVKRSGNKWTATGGY